MEPMLLLQEEAFCCTHPTTRSLAERGVGMSERFMHRSGGHSTALLQAALVIPHLPNSVHRFRTQVELVLPLANSLANVPPLDSLREGMMEWDVFSPRY